MLLCFNLTYGSVRPYSITSCCGFYPICENIINTFPRYGDIRLINCCNKQSDNIWGFLPNYRMTATPDVELMPGIKDALRGRQFNLYEVSNLKMNDHVMQLLRNSQEIIHICGFSLSIDILPMVLDLMRDGRKIAIIKDCIGDITFDHKERSLAVLEFLGIPII